MPLVGTYCCQDGSTQPFESCLASCRKRECVYPLPLLVSMAKNGEKRANAGLSATTILDCPVQAILKETNDYHEAPSEYHARWRGIGVHAMAEHDGPYDGIRQETRIRKTLLVGDTEVEISGQPDWFDEELLHLDDWKSSKACPASPYEDHRSQVNIYAWLIDGGTWDNGEISDKVVQSASIVYIDPERSVIHDVELWSTEAIEAFLIRRIEPIVSFRKTGKMPEFTLPKQDAWKKRFCLFRGTGQCCADKTERG